MKKLYFIALTSFILFSCVTEKPSNTEPIKKYFITTKEKYASKIDVVGPDSDYAFVLRKDQTYNKVYVNEIEIKPNLNYKYMIENINEDKLITFNNQYEIVLPKDLGYSVEMISNDSNIVNKGETAKFKLAINLGYDESVPIVLVNGSEVELKDNEFIVENITSDLNIVVKNVDENELVVIPEEPEVPTQPEIPDKPNYIEYINDDLSWWYRYPSTLYSSIKPTIDSDINTLISKYYGIWILDTDEKVIVLTMDEGYEYENNTVEILDIAKNKGIPITFFITGAYIDSHPELVERMINEGHVVANHSDKHLRASPALNISNETLIDDIEILANKFKSLTNNNIARLYRPPEGGYSERSLAITKDLGYKTVFWSFAYRDWLTDAQPSYEDALDTILSQIHPGAILLLHAVSNTNVAILSDLIDQVRAMGYTFITIPQ